MCCSIPSVPDLYFLVVGYEWGHRIFGCEMWDVGCEMWDVGCEMWDVRCGVGNVVEDGGGESVGIFLSRTTFLSWEFEPVGLI
jgi:hypothetical protein